MWVFSYKGESYSAQFNDSGAFSYYQSNSNSLHKLGYGINSTPKVDPNFAKDQQLSLAASAITIGGNTKNPYAAAGALIIASYIVLNAYVNSGITIDFPIGLNRTNPFTTDNTFTKPIALPFDITIPRSQEEKKEYFIKYSTKEQIGQISLEQTIRPNDKGKIYLTKALLNPTEVEQKIFLNMRDGLGYGDYMSVFLVDPDQNINIMKSISDPLEYIHSPGTLKIRPGNMIYSGPNINK